MTNILHIDSSIFGSHGQSSQLTAKFIEQFCAASSSQTDLTYRNVSVSDFPHFTAQTIEAIGAGGAEFADLLISEVQAADILVLGVPMYNFGIPSQLKSWFDHIARVETTFKYTDTGPVGLLQNKKAYVLAAHGGLHRGKGTDVETDYLKIMLGFLGITDVSFIYADGLNMGDADAEASKARAAADIEQAVKDYAANARVK